MTNLPAESASWPSEGTRLAEVTVLCFLICCESKSNGGTIIMKLDLFGRLAHIISIIPKSGLFATKRVGWVLLAAVMCATLSAWSQEPAPKAELWLGYSHLSYYPQIRGSSGRSITFNGGGGSFDWNIVKHFGLKAEFDGFTSTTKTFVIPPATSPFLPLGGTVRAQGNMFTYLFGPQVKAYFHHFEPFGEILF